MVNIDELKLAMERQGLNVSALAEKLDMSPSTLYRKIGKNGEGITIREAAGMAEKLKLGKEEAAAIFFGE